MQLKNESKGIEMIIKIVNEFKLIVVYFACPHLMQICACMWIYPWTKKTGKSGLGCWAVMGCGPLGCKPLGCRPAFSKTLELGGITMLVVIMWFEFCNQYQVVVGLKEDKGSLGSCFNVPFAECTLMAIRKKPPKKYMCTV